MKEIYQREEEKVTILLKKFLARFWLHLFIYIFFPILMEYIRD